MWEKLNIFKRLKDLETNVEVFEGRCSLYEGQIASYIDSLDKRDEAYGKLLTINEHLVNILNEHMLDKLAEADANNSSLQKITNAINLDVPRNVKDLDKQVIDLDGVE